MTQGGLIVSADGGKVGNKAVMDEFAPMDGKKSEQGIVVKKPIRKATKIGDHSNIEWTSVHPKGNDLMRSLTAHVRKFYVLEILYVLSRSR